MVDELANKLGNLLSRSTGKKINAASAVPLRNNIDMGDKETVCMQPV